MNYLDAHMIINRFIDTAANEKTSSIPVKRISSLKDSKDAIITAYKIFVAHMFAFNTRTQMEYELLRSLLFSLNAYVDDKIVDEFESCQAVLESKGFFTRLKNKSAIPFAEEKRTRLLNEISESMFDINISESIERFESEITVEAKKLIEDLNTMPSGTRETLANRLIRICDYCYKVYEIGNIPMNDTDQEYFLPFLMLKHFSTYPSLAHLYDKYRDYVQTIC